MNVLPETVEEVTGGAAGLGGGGSVAPSMAKTVLDVSSEAGGEHRSVVTSTCVEQPTVTNRASNSSATARIRRETHQG